MKIVTAVLILLLTLPAFAADPTGKWKAAMQGPDGEMQLTFNFKLDGDKVTGTVEGPMGEMPITEGKMEGDAISFTVETPNFKVVHKGAIQGDEMKLKVDMGERTMEMTAKRVTS